MSRYELTASRCPLVLVTLLFGLAWPAAAAAGARVSEAYGKLPLYFEANQGQTHPDARFLARGLGYSLYLTAGEAVLVLAQPSPDAERHARGSPARSHARALAKSAALRMSLVGARSNPVVSGLDPWSGKANYFIGKDRSKWRTNVPTYAKVHYRDVYPGIDLVYYGVQGQLEYDFVVAPGAHPEEIMLGFKGADNLEIDAQGDLVLHVGGDVIRQKRPFMYQEVDGIRHEIEGGYVRNGAYRVGFKAAAYDVTRPLVIDPVLAYSTYLGGRGSDNGFGIAIDAEGSAYLTGMTNSPDFPTTAGAFQTTCNSWSCASGGAIDGIAFVTKLNPKGSALVYSTYLGGTNVDWGSGVVVDAAGNAYVTGSTTSTDFPTTPGAIPPVRSTSPFAGDGLPDAFVTKLDPTGSVLLYSTYLGGSESDSGRGIAVDANSNVYVTGATNSREFLITPGAFQLSRSGSFDAFSDAFVTKLDPTGSALVYSTYLGGTSSDWGNGIAVDADGNAYVTGVTDSPDFPVAAGAFQPSRGGAPGEFGHSDAFATKLNPTGSALVYSTYLGGTGDEWGNGIAADANGNAYVTGPTRSNDFPVTPGAVQLSSAGNYDVFVTKLNPAALALVYSTYLGGLDIDVATGIAVDASGNAHVTGQTNSTDFPVTPGAVQRSSGGSYDAFVTKLDPTGSALAYSTYLGGTHSDSGNGIAVDASGNAYFTGGSFSINFPVTPGVFQPVAGNPSPFSGTTDLFVAKIVDAPSVVLPPLPPIWPR